MNLRQIQILGHTTVAGTVYRSTVVENERGEIDVLFTRISKLEFLLWRFKRALAGAFEAFTSR